MLLFCAPEPEVRLLFCSDMKLEISGEYIKEINRVLNTGADIDAETTCGIKVPDKDNVMKTIQNSPKAAYESAMSLDISLPSWSKVTATTKRAWDGSINGFSSVWDWLFKN